MMGSVAMRKPITIALVGVMLLSLFVYFGGVVEEVEGDATYDSGSNTIYINDKGYSLAQILSSPVPSDVFYTQSIDTYVTNANIQINDNAELIIDDGEILKFNTSLNMTINGILIVNGEEGNMALFTANETTPSAGDWQGLIFDTPEASNSNLTYLNVSYATIGIYCDGSSPTIENSDIFKCSDTAIRCDGSSPLIKGVNISENGNGSNDAGIIIISSSPIIENSTFLNNNEWDMYISSNSHPISINSNFDPLMVFFLDNP